MVSSYKVKMPKLIQAGIAEIIGLEQPDDVLRRIEHCGRVSYMTWDKEAPGTASKFVEMIIRLGHESVLEHSSVTVIFVCDRSTAQQLTRHRIASFTMESQRYCNYSNDKFGNEITFVDPEFQIDSAEARAACYKTFEMQMYASEVAYFAMLNLGAKPEDARSVLPNCAACYVAVTANLREWRHIMKLRCEKHAQHNIRRLICELHKVFKNKIPCIVSDIQV